MKEKNEVFAIVTAAGAGSRMSSDVTKQRMQLHGMSILRRTVLAFEACPSIDGIVVVAREDEADFAREELKDITKLRSIAFGAETRARSVASGFREIPKECKTLLIHDGARCLITPEMISEVVAAARKHGAASAVSSVYDTVKSVDGDGFISGTVNRDGLKFAATPQAFDFKIYEKALKSAESEDFFGITDDNMMVEAIGVKVFALDLGRENLKVTTPFDLLLCEKILEMRGKGNE